MAKEVIAAAKAHGIKAQPIKSAQAKVNAIDLTFLDDLFNWNSETFRWTLQVIDLVQGVPLWMLQRINPENAAVVAAFLQRVEDYINSRRTQPASRGLKKRK